MKTSEWKVLALALVLAVSAGGCKRQARDEAAAAVSGRIVTQIDPADEEAVETIEFDDKGRLRVTAYNTDAIGMIAHDQSLYFFGELDGKPVVVDLIAAMKKIHEQGMRRPESDPAFEEIADVRPTGRKQTVAGIEGEVHTVSWVIGNEKRSEEVVLTRDPRLAPIAKSLSRDPAFTSDRPRKAVLKEEIYARGFFPLKTGNSVVTAVEFVPVAEERFALKAVPGDNAHLVGEMMTIAMIGALAEVMGADPAAMARAASKDISGPLPEGIARPEPMPEGLQNALDKLPENPHR